MRNKIIFGIIVLLFIITAVSALGNETNSTLLNDTLNQTVNITNFSSINQTSSEEPLLLKNVYPSNFNLGEAQFNIQIENKGNNTIENVIPLISAQGLLTSTIIPIEVLSSKSTGYILVIGRFTKNGTIPLEIRIGSQKMYYNLTINSELSPQISDEIIIDLTLELKQLKQNYSYVEESISNKSELGYDVSSISLSDAKKYLREAESSILTSDISGAKANLKLASEELLDQNIKIANAKPISWFTKLKTNSLALSALAGALVTIFAAYELLKKKGTAVHSVVVNKVQEVKGKIVKK